MDKTKKQKKDILNALESSLGIVTTACKNIGISRETFYRWMREDNEFERQVKDIENISLDFAESQLLKQIKDGNVTATIFYLKTKGTKRGYIEKQDHNIHLKPFTHIEIEQKFDEYQEIKPEDNRDIPQKLNGKE